MRPARVLIAALVMGGCGFPEEPNNAKPPLHYLSVWRGYDDLTTIRATLDGARIEDVMDLHLLDGLEPYMKPEALERRIGPPTGHWTVPLPKAGRAGGDGRTSDAPAPYYDRPGGRVTLRPFPTPEQGLNWTPVAFPKECPLDRLFTDARLRTQIEAVLPEDGYVRLASAGGWARRSWSSPSIVAAASTSSVRHPSPEGTAARRPALTFSSQTA